MIKLVASLSGYALVIVISILSMIYGWGVQPASWAWIIFGHISTFVVLILVQLVAESKA